MAEQGDLVLIPRKEYEEYLAYKRVMRVEYPTRGEIGRITRGLKEIQQGLHRPWRQIKHELAD